MKILHTADLHLGAKTENRPRIDEQRKVLDEIVNICNKENIDIVAIAGDVFHTATPSAEAEDLFYDFLEKLTKKDDRAVLVVAGNHGDPKRLSACLPLAKRHNIVLASDLSVLPKYEPHGAVQIVSTGRGFVKLKKGEEVVCAALLPYPIESRIMPSLSGVDLELTEDTSYSQKVAAWANLACQNFEPNAFNMLVTHLYLVGAEEPCETEKSKRKLVKLGESMAVPSEVFPKCNYVAVGHLHTTHSVKGAKNVYYSGATSKLRFYDGAPKVLIIDTKGGAPREVPLAAACDLVNLEVKEEDIFKELSKLHKTTLVQLVVSNAQSLSSSVIKDIRTRYPNVLTIGFRRISAKESAAQSVKNLSPTELFIQFYNKKRGQNPPEALVQAFMSLLEESNETNPTEV